jgi:hypothetical protein
MLQKWKMEDIREEIKMEKSFTQTSEERYEPQSRSVSNFNHEGL